MTDKVFLQGYYAGKSHKEVATIDPYYIIEAYEQSHDNAGISNEIYRLAQINLNEAMEEAELASDLGEDDYNDYDEDDEEFP